MAEIDWSDQTQMETDSMQMLSDAPLGAVQVGPDGMIRWANPFALNLAGGPLIGQPLAAVISGPGAAGVAQVLARGRMQASANPGPMEVSVGDNRTPCELHLGRFDPDMGLSFYLLDLTRHRQLELQYNQSQKMQAVGQLAGGVAHDFNNLLTAIIGYCDLLLERHTAGDPSFPDIVQLKQNANRATNLVRQLLAFSRQQTLKPRVLDVGEVVSDIAKLAERLIGEQIDMKLLLGDDLFPVRADRGQLEQVIINLAVNARDAMPQGGALKIRADNISLSNPLGHRLGPVPAGDYVRITVEDTGTGIAPDHLDKIFEPFFTTKPVGRGTGLGLATVYGIVEQTGGTILADSTLGQGTSFSIYLPRYEGAMEEEAAEAAPVHAPVEHMDRSARILLVEDEDAVRKLACRALEKQGHEVIEAEDGEEALDLLREQGGKIDLVISDVVMPNMDGPSLLRNITKQYGPVRAILISGYAEDELRRSMGIDEVGGPHFLPKPFSLKGLIRTVDEVLADSAP